MNTHPNPNLIDNTLDTILNYLDRGDVQLQILLFFLSLLIALLMTTVARHILRRLAQRRPWRRMPHRLERLARFGGAVLVALVFPILSMALIAASAMALASVEQVWGLLSKLSQPLVTLLFYRVGMAVLVAVGEPAKASRYRQRLFVPIVCIVIVLQLLNIVVDLDALSLVVLFRIGNGAVTLGALFLATFGVYIWIVALQGTQEALQYVFTRWVKADAGSTQATLTLVRYVLTIAGIAVALTSLQLEPATLAALTAGLSVGIGFGMQEVFNNLISGLLILTERALRPGDVIEVNNQLCVVDQVSIRATRVRLLNDVEMVIPNRTFLTSAITTYTGTNRIVQGQLTIAASHDNNPDLVLDVLLETVKAHPEVLAEPAPAASLRDVTANGVNYQLTYAVNEPLRLNVVKGDLYRRIWKRFVELHIQIK